MRLITQTLRWLLPRLALTLGMIALILGMGEYAARHYLVMSHGVSSTLMHQRWADAHWGDLNSRGQRDREWTPQDLAGKTVIVVTGDSFAEGYGINDRQDRFADVLGAQLGDEYAVVLTAGSGWAPPQELSALHRLPYDPDALVLSYYINDIITGCNLIAHIDPLTTTLPPPPKLFDKLIKTSALADFVYWNFYTTNTARELFRDWSDNLEGCYVSDEVWAYHEAELLALYNWSRLRGVPMAVVIFPDMIDIGRFEAELAKTEDFFTQRGVPVVNLSEQWKTYEVDYRVASPFDSHASVPLNHQVGEALAQLEALRHPQNLNDTPALEGLLTEAAWTAYQEYLQTDDLFDGDAVVFDPSTFQKRSLEISTYYANTWLLDPRRNAEDQTFAFDFVRTGERAAAEEALTLNEEQQAALDEWRITKEPQYLKAAGVDYIFISSYWQAWLTQAEHDTLFNPENYELVRDWQTDTSSTFYQLLRVR